jgi:hypothetical protein
MGQEFKAATAARKAHSTEQWAAQYLQFAEAVAVREWRHEQAKYCLKRLSIGIIKAFW